MTGQISAAVPLWVAHFGTQNRRRLLLFSEIAMTSCLETALVRLEKLAREMGDLLP